MALTIWKFEVPLQARPTLQMPVGAEVLMLALQYEMPHIWARVDPTAELEDRRFVWVGTGHPTPTAEQARYIGTVLLASGLVFHLFEPCTQK